MAISIQNEINNKLFLTQSETDHTYDTNLFSTTYTPPNNNNSTTTPPPPAPISWDIAIDKPDFSRIRTASTGSTVSSVYSEIQLYGPSSLCIESSDIEPIFIESRALSDEINSNINITIDLPTNLNEDNTQDSYDSPSDSECDDSTPRPIPTPRPNKPIPQKIYDYNESISITNEINQENNYNKICNEILLKYKWQKCITNEEHYGAFYPNFQTEIMNNPFFKLTAGDFNDVLKKCQFIKSRWIGEKIRSTRNGMLGKYKWNIGQKITQLDLFAIKLYTDFEVCQRELKKCYRPPINGNKYELYQYEQRLCYFSHWRSRLNVAIMKYGQLLKNRIFYHGINKIMQLDMHPTHRCHGPFSATSDLEIARGFATKNGLILKMTSKFPRLGTDYFFDAAPISAYPDEKEYLIGFIYTRILNVCLGCTKLTMNDLDSNTIKKLTCFIISSLIKNNIYSYGPYLELLFYSLLNENKNMKNIFTINEIKQIKQISKKIPSIIKKEFNKIRNKMRVLKLDCISSKMKSIFYNESQTQISLDKIYSYTPNITQLHLYENKYIINNTFINNFLYFIDKHANIKLNTIKLFKYSFQGNSKQFQYKSYISKSNIIKLQTLGWYIYEYRNTNCYKLTLKKTQK